MIDFVNKTHVSGMAAVATESEVTWSTFEWVLNQSVPLSIYVSSLFVGRFGD